MATTTYSQKREEMKTAKPFRNDRGEIYRVEIRMTNNHSAGLFLCRLRERLGDNCAGVEEGLHAWECLMVEVKTFYRNNTVVIASQGFGLTPENEMPEAVFDYLEENGVTYESCDA
jgi:hypothetical protein